MCEFDGFREVLGGPLFLAGEGVADFGVGLIEACGVTFSGVIVVTGREVAEGLTEGDEGLSGDPGGVSFGLRGAVRVFLRVLSVSHSVI